jgi:hypothetical protein
MPVGCVQMCRCTGGYQSGGAWLRFSSSIACDAAQTGYEYLKTNLSPELIPLANPPELHQLVTGRIKNTNGAVRVLARGVSANQSPTRRKLMAAAVSTC